MSTEKVRRRFDELRNLQKVDPQELDGIWSALPTVHISEVYGRWKGSVFATGHPGTQQLAASQWYGKHFHSQMEAQPLLCYDEHGVVYSDRATANGEASLWMVEFRGEVTATMIYDGLPVLDHFKMVDGDTLFGIMNGKGDVFDKEGWPLYFILDRSEGDT